MAPGPVQPQPDVNRELSVIFENSDDEEAFESLEAEVAHLRKKCQQHRQRQKEDRHELALLQAENDELRKQFEELDADAENYAQETQEFAMKKQAEIQEAHATVAFCKTLCRRVIERTFALSPKDLGKYQEQMHSWLTDLSRRGEFDEPPPLPEKRAMCVETASQETQTDADIIHTPPAPCNHNSSESDVGATSSSPPSVSKEEGKQDSRETQSELAEHKASLATGHPPRSESADVVRSDAGTQTCNVGTQTSPATPPKNKQEKSDGFFTPGDASDSESSIRSSSYPASWSSIPPQLTSSLPAVLMSTPVRDAESSSFTNGMSPGIAPYSMYRGLNSGDSCPISCASPTWRSPLRNSANWPLRRTPQRINIGSPRRILPREPLAQSSQIVSQANEAKSPPEKRQAGVKALISKFGGGSNGSGGATPGRSLTKKHDSPCSPAKASRSPACSASLNTKACASPLKGRPPSSPAKATWTSSSKMGSPAGGIARIPPSSPGKLSRTASCSSPLRTKNDVVGSPSRVLRTSESACPSPSKVCVGSSLSEPLSKFGSPPRPGDKLTGKLGLPCGKRIQGDPAETEAPLKENQRPQEQNAYFDLTQNTNTLIKSLPAEKGDALATALQRAPDSQQSPFGCFFEQEKEK